MSLRESLENGFKAVQEETKKQFENAKEAIANFKPHQLEKKVADAEKDICKYNDLIDDLEFKGKEYEFKKSFAIEEKKLAEERLKVYNKSVK
jgi:glucan-binding YG repeat protein